MAAETGRCRHRRQLNCASEWANAVGDGAESSSDTGRSAVSEKCQTLCRRRRREERGTRGPPATLGPLKRLAIQYIISPKTLVRYENSHTVNQETSCIFSEANSARLLWRRRHLSDGETMTTRSINRPKQQPESHVDVDEHHRTRLDQTKYHEHSFLLIDSRLHLGANHTTAAAAAATHAL